MIKVENRLLDCLVVPQVIRNMRNCRGRFCTD